MFCSFLFSQWSSTHGCCLPRAEHYQMPTFPFLCREYSESWEYFMVKDRERKILCTSPSSDSKLTVANVWMQSLVYHFAGSWSQSLDILVGTQLDISQPHIMSLIHWILLRLFMQIKSSAFQSNVSTPFCSNFSTANWYLYCYCFLLSVHFKPTLHSRVGACPRTLLVFLKQICISCLVLSWLGSDWLLAVAQQCNNIANMALQSHVFVCVCLRPLFQCSSLWFNNLLGFYWGNKLSGVLFIPLLSLPAFLKST